MVKQAPARTYATPGRVVTSVEKMGGQGGKTVRYVISKDSRGRYYPVFVGNVKEVSDAEMEGAATPTRQRRTATKKAAKKATRRPAKKATTRGNTRGRKTLH